MSAGDVPAVPVGRDLTAQDVRDALEPAATAFIHRDYADDVAEYLNRIARPSGGAGQPDTAESMFAIGDRVRGKNTGRLGIVDASPAKGSYPVWFDGAKTREWVGRHALEPAEPRADDGTDLRELRIDVCENCIARKPGTCHVPGCFYIRHTVDEVPTYLERFAVQVQDEPDMTKHALPEELLTLDELIANVENALECAAIEVVVWETDDTGARTIESPHPMYRLARCLRSYGLLDERRDRGEDAEDDTTETWTFQRGWREGATWQRHRIRELIERAKTSDHHQQQLDALLADDPGEGQQ